jgi:hypothetical protein
MTIRRRAVAAGTAAALAAALLTAPGATALAGASHGRHAAPAGTAFLRGAHLSPDTPSVDVYLTAFAGGRTTLWLSNVGYGDVSGYRRVPAGTYAVSMRPHGAPAATKPALTWTIHLAAGHSYTAAAIGNNANLHGVIFGDAMNAPRGHRALVRVIQASDRASPADVSIASGATIAAHARFGATTRYVPVRSGRVDVTVRTAGGHGPTVTTPVRIAGHSVVSLAVLDTKGGGTTVRPLVDAAGAPRMPVGSVSAGGGGTAAQLRWLPVLGGVGGIGVLLELAAAEPLHGVAAVVAHTRTAVPRSLVIRSVRIRSSLQPLGLQADGALESPSQWQRAGWYAGGVVPGQPGPAVIAGHVDSYLGPAVFYRLHDIRRGARVRIAMSDGERLTYVVDAVKRYAKNGFPRFTVYGTTPDPELRLVTCTGRFDEAALSYVDNLVVFAHLAGASSP